MKNQNAPYTAGVLAILLAANSVVCAQVSTAPNATAPNASANATAPNASANASDSQSSTRQRDNATSANVSDSTSTNGEVANAPGSTTTNATNATSNALSSRTATTPIVSTNGVVTSGLADARNRDDANAPLFTLVDALTLALQNNPTLQVAQASLRAAQARVGTARSQGGAKVGLNADINGNRSFGSTSSTGNGGNGGGGNGGGGNGGGNTGGSSGATNNVLGFDTTQSAGVSATLPIYTGGRVKAGTRVAQANVSIQAANALQTEQDLLFNTTNSYLNILRFDQLLTVAGSNVEISREQLRIAEVRYNAGAAARLEVFQAQATLADAEQRRTAASATLGQSKATLNTLIGRVPETPLRVESISSLDLRLASFAPNATSANVKNASLTTSNSQSSTRLTDSNQSAVSTSANATNLDATGANATSTGATSSNATSENATNADATTTSPNATSVGSASATTPIIPVDATLSSEDLRARASSSRPTLAASQAQIESANANVDLAKAQRKPSLGLNLGALLRNPVSFAGRFALSLGLGLSQSLFDSGRSRSQITEAQALLDQSRAAQSSTRLNVNNQIEQSLLTLDSAQARTVSADAAVSAAQEALRASQVGYQAGVRTSLDVSTAQTALLNAQTNAVNARFDVATGQAQLASAVGVLTTQEQDAATRVAQAQAANRAIAEANAPKPKKKRKKFLGIF